MISLIVVVRFFFCVCVVVCLTFPSVGSSKSIVHMSPVLVNAREGAVAVIHPHMRTVGRLWLDVNKIIRTKGYDRGTQTDSNNTRPPTVCLLYQEDRCFAGSRCNQIHVKRNYMQRIHMAALGEDGSSLRLPTESRLHLYWRLGKKSTGSSAA